MTHYEHSSALAWSACRKYDAAYPFSFPRTEQNLVIRNHEAYTAALMGNKAGYLALTRAASEGLC